jgi:hypothetical protein
VLRGNLVAVLLKKSNELRVVFGSIVDYLRHLQLFRPGLNAENKASCQPEVPGARFDENSRKITVSMS